MAKKTWDELKEYIEPILDASNQDHPFDDPKELIRLAVMATYAASELVEHLETTDGYNDPKTLFEVPDDAWLKIGRRARSMAIGLLVVAASDGLKAVVEDYRRTKPEEAAELTSKFLLDSTIASRKAGKTVFAFAEGD